MSLLLRQAAGMSSILLMLLLVGTSFVGLGLGVRRAFGRRDLTLDDCFRAFWVGFALTLLFLLLWNFAAPVDGRVLPIVLVAGLLSLYRSRAELRRARLEGWKPSLPARVGFVLGAVWIADQCLGPLRNWDSGLYHLQGVTWAESYRVVPGLANLFGPLGFNNGGYLYDAMLNAGPWQGSGFHLANGLLILALLWQGLAGTFRLRGASGTTRACHLFDALLIAPAVHVAMRDRISSYVTDIGPSMVLMVVASTAFGLLYTGAAMNGGPRQSNNSEGAAIHRGPLDAAYDVVVIALLLCLAVCLKMNAAIFAALTLPICLGYWWWHHRGDSLVTRTVLWVIVAVPLFGGAWMARGVMLSGYPLFPSTLLPAPVEWRAPEEHAKAEFAYVVHSARATTENYPVIRGEVGMRGWVGNWARHANEEPHHILVPSLILLAALALHVRRGFRPAPGTSAAPWLLVIPILGAITAWFLAAPEPRYVEPMFWSLAALAVAMLLRPAESAPKGLTTALLLLGISPLIVTPLVKPLAVDKSRGILGRILSETIQSAGDSGWFQPISQHPSVTPYRTRSGLVLNVPPDRCWDAPLPCTPNPAPNLRQRVAGELGAGFVVDGDWSMEHWPADRRKDFLPAWRQRVR